MKCPNHNANLITTMYLLCRNRHALNDFCSCLFLLLLTTATLKAHTTVGILITEWSAIQMVVECWVTKPWSEYWNTSPYALIRVSGGKWGEFALSTSTN